MSNDQIDAARYRALREMHWNNKGITIVQDATKLPLGTQCLSGAALDDAIDEMIARDSQN